MLATATKEATSHEIPEPSPVVEEDDVEAPEEATPSVSDLAERLKALAGSEEPALIDLSSPKTEAKTFDPPAEVKAPEPSTVPAENSLIARIKAAQQTKKDPLPPPPPPTAPVVPAPPVVVAPPPPTVEEPPPPFPAALEATPPPSAFFASPPPVMKDADFAIVDHPPPPVFEAPPVVVSAPPITPVAERVAPAPPLTSTMEPPPPTFEQFLGNMSTEPIEQTSYPSLSSLPPEPAVHQPLHQSSTQVSSPSSSTLDMSDAAIAQQREILEQIERSKNSQSSAPSTTAAAATTSASPLTTQHEITPGKNVTLYSQDATKKAVEEGTAHLVKCLSCNGWMQVIKSATLVFCPNCQVISPVSAENSKELNGQVSMVSALPGESSTATKTATTSSSDSSTQNDAALAAMLQAQFDEEDQDDAVANATTSDGRRIMPDIMGRRNQPLTAEQRREHIASLTPSQRALHGFEEPEGQRLMPVNVGTELQNMPARETQSAGMLSCIKSGVESAGTAVRESFAGMNFLGRKKVGGGYPGSESTVLLSNLGESSDQNYALLEEDDL